MAAMVFGMPQALFPQLATRLGGPAVLGPFYAAPALGSLLVSATSGWMTRSSRRGRAIVLAAASWGLAIIAFGFAPDLWVALLALVVAGSFDMVSGIMRSTIWNTTIPDSLRGRLAGALPRRLGRYQGEGRRGKSDPSALQRAQAVGPQTARQR